MSQIEEQPKREEAEMDKLRNLASELSLHNLENEQKEGLSSEDDKTRDILDVAELEELQ
jgi:hypothetical protein